MRDQRTRQQAVSNDGGLTWTDQRHVPELIEPICQASIRRLVWPSADRRSVILFSNPASSQRDRLTVRASFDEGQTWPASQLLDPRPSAYSCLAALPDGGAGILYEAGDQHPYQTVVFARFPLDWFGTNGRQQARAGEAPIQAQEAGKSAASDDAALGLGTPAPVPTHSLNPSVLLPDGNEFMTWEVIDPQFNRTYFVNATDPAAADANPGTKERPFATINRAAQVLQPGERVVVGPGIYRERVRPTRGGSSPTQLISYEAEPGAQVILRGSRVFSGQWTRGKDPRSNVWSAHLDDTLFDGYRPFALSNVTEEQFESMDWAQPQRGKLPFTLVRGLVFQDGRRLLQVPERRALDTHTGDYWVDRTSQVLHARFFDDADPAHALIEVTTQDTILAPDEYGLGFIRVKGFVVEHAAGPFPWEQVGAISTTRGHHWIIEDCTVRDVNGVGLDLGIQHPRWPQPPQVGFHIVRRNVVTDCGICGICGLGSWRRARVWPADRG